MGVFTNQMTMGVVEAKYPSLSLLYKIFKKNIKKLLENLSIYYLCIKTYIVYNYE